MLRPRHLIVMLLALALLVLSPMAQDKEKIKKLTPTHRGTTGLFNLAVADTLRQGEFSISVVAHKFHRDPGDLDYTIFPVTFTVGLHDRIELFGSYEAYKRVNSDDIMVNKLLPRDPLAPARLFPSGAIGYFNESPFMDTGFGDGDGDLWAGVKINLLSERYGNPMGLSLQPIVKFHLTDEKQHLLRGLTSGATDGGMDLILSKNLPGGGTLTGNVGYMFAGGRAAARRTDWVQWGAGAEVPLGSQQLSLIAEVVGSIYCDPDIPNAFINDSDPVDGYVGLRAYPVDWMSVSGGANYHFTGTDAPFADDSQHVGFYAQAAFARKINRPPTVTCSPTQTEVTQGETARISAEAYDSDDDSLSITWKSQGGRLSQTDGSATLDTSGLDPGRYSVVVEVDDGDNVASCSTDVVVVKDKQAPTISCQPSSASVQMGQSTTLRAQASDPNGDDLTYAWAVNGQSVSNNRPEFDFGTAGRSPGRYTVRATATDVDNMSASCEFTVSVNERPNDNPTCSLSLSSSEVFAGESVTATAQASDPDNDPISYSWRVDGQSRSGSGSSLSINTSGMAGGSHSVAVTVTDDRGGSCSDTASFAVVEKIVIPINNIQPDNKAKAQLDEIALKLQQNPQLQARITGHTDDRGSDEANERVGMRRAEATQAYLVEQHGIDESRIDTLSAGESSPIADNSTAEGRQQNRRVEVELFVP